MRNAVSRTRPIAVIVGVGARLGRSIAKKFAHHGYTIAILARNPDGIARDERIHVYAIRIDCSNMKSVRDAFESVSSLGCVEVLVYNACPQQQLDVDWHPTSSTNVPIEAFMKSMAVSSAGPLHCAQQVLPGMIERGRGTILFTGSPAALYGIAGYTELCCGKFALRALSQCLAREYRPHGIHVAHVIIDGVIGFSRQTPNPNTNLLGVEEDDGSMDPDVLAETYYQLHIQDRNAWTQEMDLRSASSSSGF